MEYMDLLLFIVASGMFFYVSLSFPKREKYGPAYTFLAILFGAIVTNLGIEPNCGDNWLSRSIGKGPYCSSQEGVSYIINSFGMRLLIILCIIIAILLPYSNRLRKGRAIIQSQGDHLRTLLQNSFTKRKAEISQVLGKTTRK